MNVQHRLFSFYDIIYFSGCILLFLVFIVTPLLLIQAWIFAVQKTVVIIGFVLPITIYFMKKAQIEWNDQQLRLDFFPSLSGTVQFSDIEGVTYYVKKDGEISGLGIKTSSSTLNVKRFEGFEYLLEELSKFPGIYVAYNLRIAKRALMSFVIFIYATCIFLVVAAVFLDPNHSAFVFVGVLPYIICVGVVLLDKTSRKMLLTPIVLVSIILICIIVLHFANYPIYD